jgi:hypothetical protein
MTMVHLNPVIFEFTITSADMRSLDQNQRRIGLLKDEDGKLFVRGEVPGCGAECNANLSEVILEFIMSCERCSNPEILDHYLESFSAQVSNAIVLHTMEDNPEAHLKSSLECIFGSMNGEFLITFPEGNFGFDECPICAASKRTGIQRGLRAAHLAFFKLCQQTLQSISTEYALVPVDENFEPGHSLWFKLEKQF